MAITPLHQWILNAGFSDTAEGGASLLQVFKVMAEEGRPERRPMRILLHAMRWYTDLRQCLFPITFSVFVRDYYGIHNPENLLAWMSDPRYPVDIDKYLAIIDPAIKIETEKTVPYSYLQSQILTCGIPLEPNCVWASPDDSSYSLISRSMLDKIIVKSPVRFLPYIPERVDCDDFAQRLFRGWLAYCGDATVCLDAHFNIYSNPMSAHAMNLWVLADGTICISEPQNSSIYPAPAFVQLFPQYRIREVRA